MNRLILISTVVFTAVTALVALPFSGSFSAGVLIGAVTASVNFWLVAKVFLSAVSRNEASSGRLVLFTGLKILIAAAGVCAAIFVGKIAVFGFFVGVMVALAATAYAGLKQD